MEDVKTFQYLIERTRCELWTELIRRKREKVGQKGLVTILGPCSPLQQMINFDIGLERTVYLLADHPKIAEVSVVGIPHRRLGEEVVTAVVVAKEGQEIKLGDLVDFLKSKDIAAYKLPARLVSVDDLPRNAVGKILKRELRQQLQAASPRS